jgi:hypothetical protein
VRPALTRGDGGGGARLRTGDERWLQTGYELSRLGQWRRRGWLQNRVVRVAREAASGAVGRRLYGPGAHERGHGTWQPRGDGALMSGSDTGSGG